MAEQRGCRLFDALAPGAMAPHMLGTRSVDTHAGGFKELPDGTSMKELLVGPATHERNDLRIFCCAGSQQTLEIHDGVGLDVHHVSQTADLLLCDRIVTDAREIQVSCFDFLRVVEIALEIKR